MKRSLRIRGATQFIILLLGLALDESALASNVTWGRIEVDAHLDNSGTLHVRERMFVTVDGEMPSLERKITTSTDQAFLLQRLVREDAGQETVFVEGWDKKNEYMWRGGTLTWWIRDATDPKWEEQPLVYRFDYELRNALAPAWDIPAGPDSFQFSTRFPHFFTRVGATLSAWADARASFNRRYRLEHDVLFPWFSEREREELNYTLRYDDAWRMVHPESDIGRGTRGSDFRVTQLLDYLAPGWPPAIELWKPAARVGSIFAFLSLATLLWLVVAIRLIRSWGLTGQRVDRHWFAAQIGSQRPEMFACQLGTRGLSQFLSQMLGRLRANGVIAVHAEPAANEDSAPNVHLQLLGDVATLQLHERLMMAALFPRGAESGSKLLAEHYANPGFSPEEALEAAIEPDVDHPNEAEHAVPAPAPPPLIWRIVRGLVPWLMLSAVPLLVLDSVYGQRPMELVLACFPFFAVVMLVASFLPQRSSRLEMLSSGGIGALVAFVPVLIATVGVFGLHFYRNTPLTAYGSVAVALFALTVVAALLSCAQSGENRGLAQQKRIAALGERYARRELQKPHPGLDDTWIPHLSALGLEPMIASWRVIQSTASANNSAFPKTPAARFDGSRPFTGIAPSPVDDEWIDALRVPSEEERIEEEEWTKLEEKKAAEDKDEE